MFCRYKKPFTIRTLRLAFLGIIALTLFFTVMLLVILPRMKGGIMHLVSYAVSWLLIGIIVIIIYVLALVSNPLAFFRAMGEIGRKLKGLARAPAFFRRDYADYKKKLVCKMKGHLWENGTHGRCQRNCGWYKAIP